MTSSSKLVHAEPVKTVCDPAMLTAAPVDEEIKLGPIVMDSEYKW